MSYTGQLHIGDIVKYTGPGMPYYSENAEFECMEIDYVGDRLRLWDGLKEPFWSPAAFYTKVGRCETGMKPGEVELVDLKCDCGGEVTGVPHYDWCAVAYQNDLPRKKSND